MGGPAIVPFCDKPGTVSAHFNTSVKSTSQSGMIKVMHLHQNTLRYKVLRTRYILVVSIIPSGSTPTNRTKTSLDWQCSLALNRLAKLTHSQYSSMQTQLHNATLFNSGFYFLKFQSFWVQLFVIVVQCRFKALSFGKKLQVLWLKVHSNLLWCKKTYTVNFPWMWMKMCWYKHTSTIIFIHAQGAKILKTYKQYTYMPSQ